MADENVHASLLFFLLRRSRRPGGLLARSSRLVSRAHSSSRGVMAPGHGRGDVRFGRSAARADAAGSLAGRVASGPSPTLSPRDESPARARSSASARRSRSRPSPPDPTPAPDPDPDPSARHTRAWSPNAWTVVAAATLVQSCGGLTYSFSVFSERLREIYPSQASVDLLGLFKDLGAYWGLTGGLLYDHFGPRWTLACGAAQHLLGYLAVYAILVGSPALGGVFGPRAPPVGSTAAILAFAANGNSLFDTAALLCAMEAFPNERGVVSGLMKAYLGLSSAIFAQVYAAAVPDQEAPDAPARFVLLVAVVGGAVAFACVPLLRRGFGKKEQQQQSPAGAGTTTGGDSAAFREATFSRLDAALLGLVAVVSCATAIGDRAEGSRWSRVVNAACVFATLAALFAPWAVLARRGALGFFESRRAREAVDDTEEDAEAGEGREGDEGDDDRDRDRDDRDGDGVLLREPLLRRPASAADDSVAPDSPPPLPGQTRHDVTLGRSFVLFEMWLLFFAIMFSSGAAMTLVNNLEAINASVRSPPSRAAALVSVFSVANCLGRLLGGAASERALRGPLGLARPHALAVAAALVGAGVLAPVVSPGPGGVLVAVAVVGASLGAHWGILPVICAEIFGEKATGAVYGWLSVSPVLGSYVLSVRVFGGLYDRASAAAGAGAGGACVGGGCFREAFAICAIASAASAALAAGLGARTARVYEWHARRIREASAERAVEGQG